MSQWDAGFEYADLERLVSRALHSHVRSADRDDTVITEKDIETALDTFKPAAQWKASNEEGKTTWHSLDTHRSHVTCCTEHITKSKGLEDVGGMQEVKAMLRDCVELPIKHPELMKQCPLRLMSNVLLYGPPGYPPSSSLFQSCRMIQEVARLLLWML